MTLLSNTEQERATCPQCSAILGASDVHSAAALRSTLRAPVPSHLRPPARDELADDVSKGPSSKIQALLQVRFATAA